MRISKWGNSLAIRLPASVVAALDLKDGDDVDVHVEGARSFSFEKKPDPGELLARVRRFRGRLPADFKFDRLEARER